MLMMKIGLISDTHIPEAGPELWPQVYDAFRGVDLILHGGDIHELALLDELERIAQVYSARGNGEDGSGGRQVQPDDPRLRDTWVFDFEGLRIGLTHDLPVPEVPPLFTVRRWVDRLFPDETLDILIYGDTHVEAIDTIEGILCVNPGSPTYPHGLKVQHGTIGFLELDDGDAQASVWQITDSGIAEFDWKKVWSDPKPR